MPEVGSFLKGDIAGLPTWAWGLVIVGGIGAAHFIPKFFGGGGTAQPTTVGADPCAGLTGQDLLNCQATAIQGTIGQGQPTIGNVPVIPPGMCALYDNNGNLIGWQQCPTTGGGGTGGGGTGGGGTGGGGGGGGGTNPPNFLTDFLLNGADIGPWVGGRVVNYAGYTFRLQPGPYGSLWGVFVGGPYSGKTALLNPRRAGSPQSNPSTDSTMQSPASYTTIPGWPSPQTSLAAIAARRGLSVERLLALNPHITNPALVYAGERVRIS